MPLQTDFNRVPYYDDYDPDKHFHRILFRPGTAVQARELTQLQTIFQNQIEKFGKHVFIDGSVIDGCDLSFDKNIQYLKITDNYTNGAAIAVTDLIDKYIVANSQLKAYVYSTTEGSEGTPPDLKTAYIKYINSGTYANGAQQSKFDPNEILTVYTTANVNFGSINVANTTSSHTGNSFSASVTSGVIFHKGIFIGVDSQKIVVSKYNNSPNNVSVGFVTTEEIITPEIDTTLLDNAQGSFNYNAPGAHRIKLTPTLTVRNTATVNTTDTSSFFTIADFQNGSAVRIFTDPKYAIIGDELARRTFEESGNYVVNPFSVTTDVRYNNGVANTTYFNSVVDKGIGYVQGYRIQYDDKTYIPTRKGTDNEVIENQTITGNFGNYILAKEVSGTFDFNNLNSISLRDTIANSVSTGVLTTGSAPGTEIGKANIRTIIYYSGVPGTGSAQYKMYLSNIRMNSGKTFKDIRSVYGISGGNKGFADVVLTDGNAILKESNLSSLVLPLGKSAVKNLRNSETAPDDYITYYTFRTSNTVTFTTAQNSVATLTIPTSGVGTSGQELPYGGGTLSETTEYDFVVIATNSANTANLTGTVSTSGATVTGIGTNFGSATSGLNNLQTGDFVYIANTTTQELKQVLAVTNTTVFTVNSNFVGTFPSGAVVKRHIPAGSIVNLTKPTANISVTSTSTANLYVGTPLNVDLNSVVYYNIKRLKAVGISKVINKNRYVKIDLSTNTTGPWCLGLPDVLTISGIYIGNSISSYGEYSTSNRNIIGLFALDNGQRDDRYDLAYIRTKTNQTFSSTDRLLIKLDHFTHNKSSGVGFSSIESYPIDDANTTNINAITTMQIPRFNTTTGKLLDLRDCIDFRPIVANTANSATIITNATVNPSNTITFDIITGGAYSFVPDEDFVTDFSYYISRIDKIYLDGNGNIGIYEGVPSLTPKTPSDKPQTMTLGVLKIPPYPSLPYNYSLAYGRPDYAVQLSVQQVKRFTMRDIGLLEDRIKRLEYYTTLNMLELSTKQTSVLDSNGNDRFKNGFLVDPFNDSSIADTNNLEFTNYSPGFDLGNSEIVPRQIINYVPLDNDTNVSIGTYGKYIHNKNDIPNKTYSLLATGEDWLSQPGASKKRNISEGTIFTYKGNVTLDPPGNHKIDITTNPSMTVQIATLGNVRTVNQVLIGSAYTVTQNPSTLAIDSNLTSTITPSSSGTTYTVNDIVQDITVQPYLDPILIKFSANGLKPNTNMHVFFDSTLVDSLCQQTNSTFVATSNLGAQLKTDSSGNLYGLFFMPRGVFRTGERIFKLVDIVDFSTSSNIITNEASTIFYGSNIDIARASVNFQTQPHDVELISTLTKPVMSTPTPIINNTFNTINNNYNNYVQNIYPDSTPIAPITSTEPAAYDTSNNNPSNGADNGSYIIVREGYTDTVYGIETVGSTDIYPGDSNFGGDVF
jgi:hypothetical protein